MTHSPPVGHGDFSKSGGVRLGCVDLLIAVQERVKPKYHVFGHVHSGKAMESMISCDLSVLSKYGSMCSIKCMQQLCEYPRGTLTRLFFTDLQIMASKLSMRANLYI